MQNAAHGGYRDVELRELLSGHVVSEVMDAAPVVVRSGLSVSELVDDWFLARNLRGAPVVTNDWFEGIVTISDVRTIPREQWDQTVVRAIMTPRERVYSVAPTDSVETALRLLSEHDVDQLPVLDDGQLVGLLRRSSLVRFVHLQQALGSQEARRIPAASGG
jgi:CBS domain-containing protein